MKGQGNTEKQGSNRISHIFTVSSFILLLFISIVVIGAIVLFVENEEVIVDIGLLIPEVRGTLNKVDDLQTDIDNFKLAFASFPSTISNSIETTLAQNGLTSSNINDITSTLVSIQATLNEYNTQLTAIEAQLTSIENSLP